MLKETKLISGNNQRVKVIKKLKINNNGKD